MRLMPQPDKRALKIADILHIEPYFTHAGILNARMSMHHCPAASRNCHNSICRLALPGSYNVD